MTKATEKKQPNQTVNNDNYVGTLVGESTSSEFRLAVTPEAIKEQDIIAVNAELNANEKDKSEKIRIWAKVQKIERLNPLFPEESGHELALTRTNPIDTIMSFSIDMVTAICQILGYELQDNPTSGKLKKLRYPPKPASKAYRPDSKDIARIVVGELEENSKNDKSNRGLDIATLSNRPDIDVKVDGHAIVTRHLAILAMTGFGKSWTARRIIEQLALKNYPIVIFDPHGDYTGLTEVDNLKGKINLYCTNFPIFSEDADKVMTIVESLSGYTLYQIATQNFGLIFDTAKKIINLPDETRKEIAQWLQLSNPCSINKTNGDIQQNLYFLGDFAEAIINAGSSEDQEFFEKVQEYTKNEFIKKSKKKKRNSNNEDEEEYTTLVIDKGIARNIKGMLGNIRTAAKRIRQLETVNQQLSKTQKSIPIDRKELVEYGKISILSLAGYDEDVQATIYSLIAEEIFESRVRKELKYPVLFLLEEAHNFVPAQANDSLSKKRSISITKQIAQEGRKFGVGLILISQRPSRLDETTLAMCNSYIIMRMLNPADQSFVRKVVESLGEEDTKMLPDLDVGEAILSGQFTSFPILVKMKAPESKGEHEEKNAFDALEEEYQKSKNK
ncbi:ATP-binding protein [Planktothrix agardhii]|jgi:DNA helicase HerA-like ATPase|uniref:ATP-binding protein n=1 Tax=Planktothrix agardhii TaxID=1160 RepID=UPI00040276EB|nr:ATP-binding protein [Planktothrix agardhii]